MARRKALAELATSGDKWADEDGITVKTSGGLSPEWTNRRYKPAGLWAYQPVKRPTMSVSAGQHTIDALLAQRMHSQPAPRADRGTLLRRATFDLLGLPPTPEEIVAFVSDSRGDAEAFAAVIERLLGSPHYGEHWARHWLDVVRYADSCGLRQRLRARQRLALPRLCGPRVQCRQAVRPFHPRADRR